MQFEMPMPLARTEPICLLKQENSDKEHMDRIGGETLEVLLIYANRHREEWNGGKVFSRRQENVLIDAQNDGFNRGDVKKLSDFIRRKENRRKEKPNKRNDPIELQHKIDAHLRKIRRWRDLAFIGDSSGTKP